MAYNSLHSRIDICYYEQMNIWVHKINFSWPGFSVQTAKVFPIFQKFSTWFLFSRTQALLAYSLPALYWIIGLSHYSLHPVTPGKMKKYNREKNRFPHLQVEKRLLKVESENMLESKSMILWWRVTEPELKQGLFFQIEVSGALTRGWDIILNKICPEKTDSKLEICPPPPLFSVLWQFFVIDHDTINCSI